MINSQSFQEKQTVINELGVNYKVAGNGDDVLILHGWGGSSDSWIAVQESLAEKGYRVLVPDLPGFGKSKTPDTIWGVDDYAAWVGEFLRQFQQKENTFFLIGHSFGGRLAVRYAVENPEKIKKLLLVASAGIKPKPEIKTMMISWAARIGNALLAPKIFRRFRDSARNLFYVFLRHKDYVKAEGTMRQVIVKVINEDLSEDLTKIAAKTLLVWGDSDKLVPLKYGRIFKERIKDSELVVLQKIGHSPHLEAPEKFSEIILQFLRS